MPLAVAASLAAALALTACGGDDDGSSKEEFIAAADRICAEANTRERELIEGPGWHYGPGFDDVRLLSRLSAIDRDAVRRLRALTPPEADRDLVNDMLAAMDRSGAAIDKQLAALRAGRTGQNPANVRQYENAYGDLAGFSGQLGLSNCQGVGV